MAHNTNNMLFVMEFEKMIIDDLDYGLHKLNRGIQK